MVLRDTIRLMRLPILVIVFGLFVIPVHVRGQQDTRSFIAWHPDGELVATATFTTVQIVDAQTMTVLNTFPDLPLLHTAPAWNPAGDKLAIPYGDVVQIWQEPWNPTTATLTHSIPLPWTRNYITSIDWHPQSTENDARIVVADGGGVMIWDLVNSQVVYQGEPHRDIVNQITWSPDGTRLASVSIDHTVSIWDADLSNLLGRMITGTLDNLPPSEDRAGAFSVAWNPEGTHVVVGLSDGTSRIWDVTQLDGSTGMSFADSAISKHIGSRAVYAVAWNPFNNFIASGSHDSVVVWDSVTYQTLEVVQTGYPVHSVDWSPDGEEMAFVAVDGTLQAVESPASLLSFTLLDTVVDLPLLGHDPIVDGAIIDLGMVGTWNISVRANVIPNMVGSVVFGLDANPAYFVDNSVPYTLSGESGNDILPWTEYTSGQQHTLIATPYAGPDGTGFATCHFGKKCLNENKDWKAAQGLRYS